MKELDAAEVLAIAGGLPPGTLLDEVFYRATPEPVHDPLAAPEADARLAP